MENVWTEKLRYRLTHLPPSPPVTPVSLTGHATPAALPTKEGINHILNSCWKCLSQNVGYSSYQDTDP